VKIFASRLYVGGILISYHAVSVNILRLLHKESARKDKTCTTPWAEKSNSIGFWWGILKEKDRLGVLGLDGRVIIKCVVRK